MSLVVVRAVAREGSERCQVQRAQREVGIESRTHVAPREAACRLVVVVQHALGIVGHQLAVDPRVAQVRRVEVFLSQLEAVVPVVAHQRHAQRCRGFPVDAGIGIGKGIVAYLLLAVFFLAGVEYGQHRNGEKVDERPPHSHHHGKAVFDDGRGEAHVAREQAHSEAAGSLLKVGPLHLDIDHTRHKAPIACRIGSLVKVDVVDSGSIEGREHSAQVPHVIKGQTLVEKHILVALATVHIEARKTLHALRHTWKRV